MGNIITPPPVKLIAALMVNDRIVVQNIMEILQQQWGPVDLDSDWFDFDHSDYYENEFGQNLKKKYISFENLLTIDSVPDYKIWSNSVEDQYASNANRSVNIDPGYIADAKLILATTKNLAHRIYIGKNMYADQQLIFRNHTFWPMPWTFADMKQDASIQFFNRVRKKYQEQLKAMNISIAYQ
jgi:hypothetical protein